LTIKMLSIYLAIRLLSMKSALGNPARGEAFYPRPKDLKKIERLLVSGVSVYLSAPRRVGKTSILKYLEDTQDADFYYVYVLTESVYSINEYYKVLCEVILNSEAIGRLKKISQGFNSVITTITNRVESIKGIDIRKSEEPDYEVLFYELLSHVKSEKGRLIIMIDEFPQTVANIEKEHGLSEAKKFIQKNRDIRHNKLCEEKVSFIYTGSISLGPIVERVADLTDINDVRTLKIVSWPREEAVDLIKKLFNGYDVPVNDTAINFLLDEIKWYIPFHIQLICHELVVIYDEINIPLEAAHVTEAIEATIDIKNKAQFDPYFSRLKGLLQHNEYKFALDVLKITATANRINNAVVHDLSVKYNLTNYKLILENLCEDGYLDKGDDAYSYTSPILQLWCIKHICDESV
jgi:uncharacterized protein